MQYAVYKWNGSEWSLWLLIPASKLEVALKECDRLNWFGGSFVWRFCVKLIGV